MNDEKNRKILLWMLRLGPIGALVIIAMVVYAITQQ